MKRRRQPKPTRNLVGRPRLTADERALRDARPADRTPRKSVFPDGYNPLTAPVLLRRHLECDRWCCALAIFTCSGDCPTKRELVAAGHADSIPSGSKVGTMKARADELYSACIAVWLDARRVVKLRDGRIVEALPRPTGGRPLELPKDCHGRGQCALDEELACDRACARLRDAHKMAPKSWPIDEPGLTEFAHERRIRLAGQHVCPAA